MSLFSDPFRTPFSYAFFPDAFAGSFYDVFRGGHKVNPVIQDRFSSHTRTSSMVPGIRKTFSPKRRQALLKFRTTMINKINKSPAEPGSGEDRPILISDSEDDDNFVISDSEDDS